MKKTYFLLAASTMMFAACAQTDLVNEVVTEEAPQAIEFETFANKQTRAVENNKNANYVESDLSNHHTTFKVWASKKLNGGTYVDVYAKDAPGVVTWTTIGTSSNWAVDVTKYWDKAASSYYFYAAAPSKDKSTNDVAWAYTDATTNDGSTGYITLENYKLSGTQNDNLATPSTTGLVETWKSKGNDLDLMIADKCHVTTYTSPVNLDFIHILSKLNIKVSSTGTNVTLTKLDICGLKNKGTFTENTDIDGDKDVDTDDFTELAKGSNKRWGTPVVQGTYTLQAAIPTNNLSSTAYYTHEYLIMPQLVENSENVINKGTKPTSDAYIHIQYKVGGEEYETYYSLAAAFGVANKGSLAFNEGWQNTLTIAIDPQNITFTADAASWANGTTKDDTTIQ